MARELTRPGWRGFFFTGMSATNQSRNGSNDNLDTKIPKSLIQDCKRSSELEPKLPRKYFVIYVFDVCIPYAIYV